MKIYKLKIYILYAIFALPVVGWLVKVMGKRLGFLQNESYFDIFIEFIGALSAMACLVFLTYACVCILNFKDRFISKKSENDNANS
jgi:hypothetical protein